MPTTLVPARGAVSTFRATLVALVVVELFSGVLQFYSATLLAGRFLQGMFLAFLPLMFGLVRRRFGGERTRRAVAYLSAVLLFGTMLSAVLTGLLVRAADGPDWALWSPAFGMIVGFGLLWLHRADRLTPAANTRVDWLGAFLLGVGLAGVLLGVEQGHSWGWTSVATTGCLAVGIGVLACWVVFELRVAQPLADLRFLFRRRLLPVYVVGVCVYFGAVGGQVTMSTYMGLPRHELGYGLGLDTPTMSLVLIPVLAVAAIAAMFTARIGRLIGFPWVMATGSLLATLGAVGFVFLHGSVGVRRVRHLLSRRIGTHRGIHPGRCGERGARQRSVDGAERL